MAEPTKHEPMKTKEEKLAERQKELDEQKEKLEMRNTLFAARGKSTVPPKAPITDGKYRDDVLRRVNRRSSEEILKAKSVAEQNHVLTVTMPNGLKVRLTLDDNLKPIPATILSEHIVRWEAVA